jgi:hypothetical protein
VFRTLPGIAQIVTSDSTLPRFDAHCALLSLPLKLKTTPETIPLPIPYLSAANDGAEEWRERLGPTSGDLKVGLVWASQSAFPGAAIKSLPLATFACLRGVPAVRFYSLQLGDAGRQASQPASPLELYDFTAHLRDFADTAALLAQLDLIISVDTAVAHLAGAMGKPVWTLLPYAADWRWEPESPSSSWYPGMRLFRQESRGDWDTVVSRIAARLQEESAAGATSRTLSTTAGA